MASVAKLYENVRVFVYFHMFLDESNTEHLDFSKTIQINYCCCFNKHFVSYE